MLTDDLEAKQELATECKQRFDIFLQQARFEEIKQLYEILCEWTNWGGCGPRSSDALQMVIADVFGESPIREVHAP